jgi:hypothetical protein
MTYTEYTESYEWMLKKYPDTRALWDETEEEKITCTTTNQRRSGSRWVDVDTKTEKVSYRYYANVIESVPFFRGIGGTETVKTTYTKYGLIPFENFSTSPDKQVRTVRRFVF